MKLYVWLIYMYTHIFEGLLCCSIHVCLSWTVDINQITFICKIDDLEHPVFFYDNCKREIAYCTIPNPIPKCSPLPKQHKNVTVTVTQNLTKLETVVIVKGKIDQRLNGKWSCNHGTNLSEANVEINILTAEDTPTYMYNDNPKEGVEHRPTENESVSDVNCGMQIGGAIFTTFVVTLLVKFGVAKFHKRSNCRHVQTPTTKQTKDDTTIVEIHTEEKTEDNTTIVEKPEEEETKDDPTIVEIHTEEKTEDDTAIMEEATEEGNEEMLQMLPKIATSSIAN